MLRSCGMRSSVAVRRLRHIPYLDAITDKSGFTVSAERHNIPWRIAFLPDPTAVGPLITLAPVTAAQMSVSRLMLGSKVST